MADDSQHIFRLSTALLSAACKCRTTALQKGARRALSVFCSGNLDLGFHFGKFFKARVEKSPKLPALRQECVLVLDGALNRRALLVRQRPIRQHVVPKRLQELFVVGVHDLDALKDVGGRVVLVLVARLAGLLVDLVRNIKRSRPEFNPAIGRFGLVEIKPRRRIEVVHVELHKNAPVLPGC